MRAHRMPALLLVAALLACEPPDQPPPPSGGDTGGGGGNEGGGGNAGGGGNTGGGGNAGGGGNDGGGGNAGGGGSTGDGVSSLAIVFDRQGSLARVPRIDLEVVGLAPFVDVNPRYTNADTTCDAGGAGSVLDLQRTVTLDLQAHGETPLAAVDFTHGRELREMWLVLKRGTLLRDGREYKVHASALCTMPGHQYTLVRLRPGEPVPLGGPDHRLAVTFDPSSAIAIERVDCRSRRVDECQSPDDDHDDGDPNTRLRFSFKTSLPVRVEPPT